MGSQAKEKGPTQRPKLELLLAAPRGFRAGVERAIRIVELALAKFGAPVYGHHEIVHNRHVVERLQKLATIFIEQIEEMPTGARVIFSAHGVSKSVPQQAKETPPLSEPHLPLVSRVHIEATRHHRAGCEIVRGGHAGHSR
jgi:4-hydroxy-3-methylbut-2-enyl diphosphate reductase